MKELRACAAAFTFLTRLPVGGLVSHSAADLAGTVTYFPIVGLAVGMIGALGYALAIHLWSPILAVLIAVGITMLVTGAFHEDALADAFDGFGGGWDREQVLAIMKDSRVGSYALVGVLIVIAAKVAALHAIATSTGVIAEGGAAIAGALVAGHVLGRWSSVILIRRYPYVRSATADGRAAVRPFVDAVTGVRLGIATGLTLAIVGVMLGRSALTVVAVAAALTWLSGLYFRRRIGGITGDALGSANQLVELAVYLVLAAHA